MKKKKFSTSTVLFLILVGVTIFSYLNLKKPSPTDTKKPTELSYNQLMQKIDNKQVKDVDYDSKSTKISGVLSDGTKFESQKPTDDFDKYLLQHDVQVTPATADKSSSLWAMLSSLINLLVFMAIAYVFINFLSKKMIRTQTHSMGANFNVIERSDITFDDVAGNMESKEDLMELVEFMKNPVKYKRYGAEVPRGTLLSGPPGNGKTLMVKALAGTAGVPFIATSGSQFVQQFVGVGAARVRELFKLAEKYAPCVIFIDEIDALGRQRGSGGTGASEERDQTLNQLLVEMDGFNSNKGILIVAATNRPELLDQALLRPGRFDRQINVELPDVEARQEILKIHSKNKPLANEVDLRKVAEMTIYMSGADLKNVMNEASIYAARAGHKGILMADIDRAINKVIAGEEKKNRKNITKKDKEITAYHEAGHALMAKLLTKKSVPKVTIIPTTKGAGGYTMITPEEKMFETKRDMLNELAISLGGRAAEEIVFGADNITGGAGQDLKVATMTVERMVKDYGMCNEIGLINIRELYKDSFTGSTSERIEKAIKSIIDEAYSTTKKELQENKAFLFQITQALLKKETIYQSDIDAIMAGDNILNDILEKKTIKADGEITVHKEEIV